MARERPRPPGGSKAERQAEKLAKAAHKVEAASAELRKKADQLESLGQQVLERFDLWTRPEPGSRKPRFTRDEIAQAAVRIADSEGFDALSMRRLAAELDAGTMTLYHYVKTKDELLALVNDTVMAEVLVPPDELPTEWRAALSMIAHRSRDALRRHQWSLDIRDDPAPGPNGIRHFEQTMRAVAELDLPLGDKFELVSAVDEYTFGFCMTERANPVDVGDSTDQLAAYIDELIATGEYPMLAGIGAEHGSRGAFELLAVRMADPDRFTRNLDRLLDGIEAGLRSRP